MRHYSWLDRYMTGLDTVLRTLMVPALPSCPNPAAGLSEAAFSEQERRHVAGLMRVNHVGEVCAQALYQGQALVARSGELQTKLRQAAQEEINHLIWCQERLQQLGSRTSYFNLLWYGSSLLLGIGAGLAGDKISLSFLAETERQVEQHLSDHLQLLPQHDYLSRRIVEQMRRDEIQHAYMAEQAGAIILPKFIIKLMQYAARAMRHIAYRL